MFQRYIARQLVGALERSPVVYVHGPRQCGKSTLVQTLSTPVLTDKGTELAQYEYISLDDSATRDFANFDPAGFIDQLPEFVILDEVQLAPTIFRAIKQVVDKRRRTGRFILTGSAQASLLGELSAALVGRLALVRMYPLAQSEVVKEVDQIDFSSAYGGLLSSIMHGSSLQQNQRMKPLQEKLAEMIVSGGYPEAIQQTSDQTRRWYLDYVNTVVERDVRELTTIRRLDAIPKLLLAAASQSATLFNLEQLGSSFSISRPTIQSFVTILERLFLVDFLPAWSSNEITRLVKSPKLFLADTGLACALLRLDSDALWRNRKTYGRLVESLVFHELRRQFSWLSDSVALYHYRDKDQVEVDFVVEFDDRSTVGIEVKSSRSVSSDDFKGLKKLACATSRFKLGIIFYDGEWTIEFEPHMYAIPLRRLFEDEAV